MNDNEPVTSANRSERTVVAGRERRNVPPHFDSAAVEHARPAVPISQVYSGRKWWPILIVAAAIAGLTGGVIGSLLTTKFLGHEAQQQPSQPAYVQSSEMKSETAAPETTKAPEREIIETAAGRQSPAGKNDDATAAPPKDEEVALRGALRDWVAATNARDIGRQMEFYGPTVNAFYRARNATSELVRAE
ncbi:MAG TPA: hypothetical protein VJT74_06345, partial [Pyrinomonadaceae bacterium]|nr:hypothetical protein [Pyrinomonadaceae bacterium]